MKAFLLSVSTVNWQALDTVSDSLFSTKLSLNNTIVKGPASSVFAFTLEQNLKSQYLQTNAWDHAVLSVGFVFECPQPEVIARLRSESMTTSELADPFRGTLFIMTGTLKQWLDLLIRFCNAAQPEYVALIGTHVFNLLSNNGYQPILDLWVRESRRDSIILKGLK